jgi:CRP/FNR family cyclic AMP-dependent transcriptional regulator
VAKPVKDMFDPKTFLAKVGAGKAILQLQKNQHVFEQGDVADTVFCIQRGKIKLTVMSEQGKEAVVAILGPGQFFGEGCMNGPYAAHFDDNGDGRLHHHLDHQNRVDGCHP